MTSDGEAPRAFGDPPVAEPNFRFTGATVTRNRMAMHPVRDAIASHGWLLYAMALGLCYAGIMPFPILIGGAVVWLIMSGAGTCDPATRWVARSAS